RRSRGEITRCDAVRSGREILDRPDDFAECRLHGREADERENPRDREARRHHRLRLVLELRQTQRDLRLPRRDDLLCLGYDSHRRRVDILGPRRSLRDDRSERAHSSPQRSSVDRSKRLVVEQLGYGAVPALHGRSPGEADPKCVLCANQLFECRDRASLDRDELRQMLGDLARPPADAERHAEERERERARQEQHARTKMQPPHSKRIRYEAPASSRRNRMTQRDLKDTYLETLRLCAPDILVARKVDAAMPRNVVAIGKCAGLLLDGVASRLDIASAFVAVPDGYPLPSTKADVHIGGHPRMTKASFEAGRSLVEFVDKHDDILFLVSGGGSACVEVAIAGRTNEEVAAANDDLIASSLSIHDINARRRDLSAIKGGRLRDRVRG